MFKKNAKKIIVLLAIFQFFIFISTSSAQLLDRNGTKAVKDNMRNSGKSATYAVSARDAAPGSLVAVVAVKVVSAFLGLLGIIFLIMIIIGGFNWMTAAGNDDKITRAKATLFRGVIGLLIVVAAYVITAFVFKALSGIVGQPA